MTTTTATIEPTANPTLASFRVVGDRVLVKEIEPPKKIGSIHVPDQAIDNIKKALNGRRGVVMKAGPGFWHAKFAVFVETTVKPGDKVVFTGQGIREIVLDGEKYLVMHEGLIQLIYTD